MIPPEPDPPEPDPPEPSIKIYTYNTTTEIPIGSTTGVFYGSIKDKGGNNCYLNVTLNGVGSLLMHLIVNYVPAFDMTNYYFCTSDMTCCVLASNAAIGSTVPYYAYDAINDEMVQAGTVTINSCTPSDYFDVVSSGEFEMEARNSKGVIDESDLDHD